MHCISIHVNRFLTLERDKMHVQTVIAETYIYKYSIQIYTYNKHESSVKVRQHFSRGKNFEIKIAWHVSHVRVIVTRERSREKEKGSWKRLTTGT